MHIVEVVVSIRGKDITLEVPGEDAHPLDRMIAQVEMLLLSVVAIENERADAVLLAHGVHIEGVETVGGEKRPVQIFPPVDEG